MKKILLTIIGLAMASPAWSSQTAVTEISGIQPSVGALKTQVNTKLGTVESNRQDHETRVAAMESGKETKAVVQASAPADTTVDWYDTDQESGVLILKRHNGTTWLRASSQGVQYASSCASITAGMCVDTDDGKLYYHNGTAVVEVGTGGSGTTYTAGTGIDITGGVISSTVTGSVPSGTVNGQALLWATDQWVASTPPWVTTASLGTGVAIALAAAVDGTGGLASKASLDALPNIVFGTGLTVTGNTPSAGTDTVSVTANTYQAYDSDLTTWAGITPGTGVTTALAADIGAVGGLRRIVAKGSSSLATAAIPANTCSLQPFEATNVVAYTDKPEAWIPGRLSTVAGYGVTSAGALRIDVFLTDGYINFDVCNNTNASITPEELIIPWDVTR